MQHNTPRVIRDRWVSLRGNGRAAGLRISGPPSSHRRSSHERLRLRGDLAAALGATSSPRRIVRICGCSPTLRIYQIIKSTRSTGHTDRVCRTARMGADFLRPCGWEVMLRSTGAAKPAIGGAPLDSQSESDLGPGRRRGCVVPNKCERLAPFVAVRHLRSNHKNRKKALGVFPICGCDERPFVKPRVQDPHRPPRSRRCVSGAFRGRSIC